MTRLIRSQLFNHKQLKHVSQNAEAQRNALQEILYDAKNQLINYHLENGNAETLSKHLSWLIDQVLSHVWRLTINDNSLLLIAAGGYGRQELNLESDIDLIILLPDAPDSNIQQSIERFIQLCWDLGLKCGHNTSTLEALLTLAQDDLSTMTNLLETRRLLGSAQCFARFHKHVRSKQLWPTKEYFAAKMHEQAQRHARFSDTGNNLEPNLKQSPGGLRDLHMISWVANRYFGTSDLAELAQHGFLSDSEYLTLIQSRRFLWRIRNGLHLLAQRAEDRLLVNYQRDLATQLGYQDSKQKPAVEIMMQQYYRTAKHIRILNELLLQHFQEAILAPKVSKEKTISTFFIARNGWIACADDTLFQTQPERIPEVFLQLQKHPELKGISIECVRQIRANLTQLSEQRTHPVVTKTLREIFIYQHGLTHALRRMNAHDVLGTVFKDFGKVVGQMQHDMFHIYTVDEHCLFVVRNLRRLMLEKHADELPELRSLMHNLQHRERLFIAALCHDVGKGSGKDHSIVGESISRKFSRYLGLSEFDRNLVAWLVRQHLTMSWFAQREDTSDPKVIDRFADIVGDQTHLDNLYLLTVADMRGTSDKVWNEWKGQLLHQLYLATSRRLRAGGPIPSLNNHIQDQQKAIRKRLQQTLSKHDIDRFFEQVDPEYFLRNSPDSACWHMQEIYNARLLDLPLVRLKYLHEIEAIQMLFVAPDSEALLPAITSAIEKCRLSILDARIHPIQSGLVLLVFTTHPELLAYFKVDKIPQLTQTIQQLITTPDHSYQPAQRRQSRTEKHFTVETAINFSQSEGGLTMMEVISKDRPGLLFYVAKAMSECKIRLISAKVTTYGERAEDTFFISDRDGNAIDDPQKQQQLSTLIRQYLN